MLNPTASASSPLLGSRSELWQTESCSSSEGDPPVIHMPALPGTPPIQTAPLVTTAVFMHLWQIRNSFSRHLGSLWIYSQLKFSCNDIKIVGFFPLSGKTKLGEGMLLGEAPQALERDLDQTYCEIKTCKRKIQKSRNSNKSICMFPKQYRGQN